MGRYYRYDFVPRLLWYEVLKWMVHETTKNMILLKPFLFLLFVIIVSQEFTRDDYHARHSSQGEETIRRYGREANLNINEIKGKRFDRISVVSPEQIQILQETKKLRWYTDFLRYLVKWSLCMLLIVCV